MKTISRYTIFLISFLLVLVSCQNPEGGFTTGYLGIAITAAFVAVVLFYFLFRKQHKRKGDNNKKP